MTFRDVALAYGLGSFSSVLIHNIFLLYYVDTFVTVSPLFSLFCFSLLFLTTFLLGQVYRISESAFFWGQIIFLLWNSVNDPLFGWISDRNSLKPRQLPTHLLV